jgi:hypothetical protein
MTRISIIQMTKPPLVDYRRAPAYYISHKLFGFWISYFYDYSISLTMLRHSRIFYGFASSLGEAVDGISRIPWIRVLIPQIPKIWRHFTFTKDAHLKCARHILAQRQPIAPHMRLWRFFICRWISAHCSLIRKRRHSLRSLSLFSLFLPFSSDTASAL